MRVLSIPPNRSARDYFVVYSIPKDQRPVGRKRLIVFMAVIAALLALAAAWRWTPLQDWLSPKRVADFMTRFFTPGGRALVAVAGVGLASVLMVPLTFLAIVGAAAFPGWLAFVYVLVAALVGPALGVHRRAGDEPQRARTDQRVAPRAAKSAIGEARHDRVPIAPFGVFNLVAGASHQGFRQFIVCSLLGLTPGLGAITFFSGTLWAAFSEPSWENLAIATAAGLGLTGRAVRQTLALLRLMERDATILMTVSAGTGALTPGALRSCQTRESFPSIRQPVHQVGRKLIMEKGYKLPPKPYSYINGRAPMVLAVEINHTVDLPVPVADRKARLLGVVGPREILNGILR